MGCILGYFSGYEMVIFRLGPDADPVCEATDGCNLHTMRAVLPPCEHHLSPLTRESTTTEETQISCEPTLRVDCQPLQAPCTPEASTKILAQMMTHTTLHPSSNQMTC